MRGLILLTVIHCQGLFKLSRLYLHKLSCTCAVMQTTFPTFVWDIHFFWHIFLSIHNTRHRMHRCHPWLCPCRSHQAPCVGVDAVGGVDELGTGFGVLRKLLVVVEPAVLGGREALVLQAPQLRRRSHRDGLGDAAPRYHRFHCTQTRTWMNA